jgi:Tetracyclin repressor-like, C-terminal domain
VRCSSKWQTVPHDVDRRDTSPGPSGADSRDQAGGAPPGGTGGSIDALASRRRSPSRHGLVRDLSVLPEPRPAPHGAHHRLLRRHRSRRRGRHAAYERGDFAGRWRAACHGVRGWALEHPHEYALLYGSPVPGYRAPQDTTGPASWVTLVFADVVRDAAASGALGNPFVPERAPALSKPASAEASRVGSITFPGVPDDAVVRALTAWTQLFGFVSFELFGRYLSRWLMPVGVTRLVELVAVG